jgi:nucleoid-associated protein YgaU
MWMHLLEKVKREPPIYEDENVSVQDAGGDHVEVVIRRRKTLWDDLNRHARKEGEKIDKLIFEAFVDIL